MKKEQDLISDFDKLFSSSSPIKKALKATLKEETLQDFKKT